MLEDAHDPLRCARCREPAILTVGNGVCPRCFHLFESEALWVGAEMDRILGAQSTRRFAAKVAFGVARRIAERAVVLCADAGRTVRMLRAARRRNPPAPAPSVSRPLPVTISEADLAPV